MGCRRPRHETFLCRVCTIFRRRSPDRAGFGATVSRDIGYAAARLGEGHGERQDPVTEFRGEELHCWRGGRPVFAGLAFALGPGDALLVTGPNGAGKSSLLRLMATLIAPAEGALYRDGTAVADDPAAHREGLHYVGHLDAVKSDLSVRETLRFWSRLGGSTDSAADALGRFGLAALADLPGRMLSAGQKRKLALARLFCRPAGLWLLDEPTSALDAAGIKELEAALAAHRAAGGIAVVTTHGDIALPDAKALDIAAHAVAAEALI